MLLQVRFRLCVSVVLRLARQHHAPKSTSRVSIHVFQNVLGFLFFIRSVFLSRLLQRVCYSCFQASRGFTQYCAEATRSGLVVNFTKPRDGNKPRQSLQPFPAFSRKQRAPTLRYTVVPAALSTRLVLSKELWPHNGGEPSECSGGLPPATGWEHPTRMLA